MPSYSRKVKIQSKSSQELYQKISEEIDRFLEKSSIGKYELERHPEQKKIKAKSALFSAELTCQEEIVILDVQLSLLATPFKSKLDDGLTKWLNKHFSGLVSG